MISSRIQTLFSLFLCLFCFLSPIAVFGDDSTAKKELSGSEINLLIRQLGHSRFSVRQTANRELVEAGIVIIPQLREFKDHPDRELRLRARRLLDFLSRIELQQKAAMFHQAKDPAKLNLPCWKEFNEFFEGSKEGQLLFNAILREELELIAQADDQSNEFEEIIARKMEAMSAKLELDEQANRTLESISSVSICALLYSIHHRKVPLDSALQMKLVSVIRTNNLYRELKRGMHKAAANRIFDQLIVQNPAINDSTALAIHFPQIIPRAKEIITNRQISYLRERAITTLKSWGDESEIKFLEKYFDDDSRVDSIRFQNTTPDTIPPTFGDLAFAAAVKIAEYESAEFKINDNDLPVYKSPEERSKSREHWKKLRAKETDPDQSK